jgi:hypothetical protein
MRLIKYIKEYDKELTHKLAICSNPANGTLLAYLRILCICLEWSFHGIPWFVLVIISYLAQFIPELIAKALFLGKIGLKIVPSPRTPYYVLSYLD